MTYPEYYDPPNIPTSGWDRIELFSFSITRPPAPGYASMYGVMFIFNPTTVYYLEYCGLQYSLRLSCLVWDALIDLNHGTTGTVRLVVGSSSPILNTVFTCKTIPELHDHIRKLQILENL